MSVTKTTGAEVYSVKSAGEWATIVVRAWDEPGKDGQPWHRGELLINSTFGSWSNYWNAPGIPFKQFLVGLDFDYLMGKLLGRHVEEHDGLGTFRYLKERMLEMRRKGRIDKDGAAWLWREMNDRHESLEGSVESFVGACGDILKEAKESWSTKHTRHAMDELSELLSESWSHTKTRVTPAAKGFWRDIWPKFIQALKLEIEEASEEPAVTSERPRA